MQPAGRSASKHEKAQAEHSPKRCMINKVSQKRVRSINPEPASIPSQKITFLPGAGLSFLSAVARL